MVLVGLLRILLRTPPPLRNDIPAAAAAVGERPDLLLLLSPLARRSTITPAGLVAEPLVLSLLLASTTLVVVAVLSLFL